MIPLLSFGVCCAVNQRCDRVKCRLYVPGDKPWFREMNCCDFRTIAAGAPIVLRRAGPATPSGLTRVSHARADSSCSKLRIVHVLSKLPPPLRNGQQSNTSALPATHTP